MNPKESPLLDTMAPAPGQHTWVTKPDGFRGAMHRHFTNVYKSTGHFSDLPTGNRMPPQVLSKGSVFHSCGNFERPSIHVNSEEPPDEFGTSMEPLDPKNGNYQLRPDRGLKKGPFKSKSGEKMEEGKQKDDLGENIDTALSQFEGGLRPVMAPWRVSQNMSLTKPANKAAADIDATMDSANRRVYPATQRWDSNHSSPQLKPAKQVHSFQDINHGRHPGGEMEPDYGHQEVRQDFMQQGGHHPHQFQQTHDGDEELLSPGSSKQNNRHQYETEAVLEEDHGSNDGDSGDQADERDDYHRNPHMGNQGFDDHGQMVQNSWEYHGQQNQELEQQTQRMGTSGAKQQSASAGILKVHSLNSQDTGEPVYAGTSQPPIFMSIGNVGHGQVKSRLNSRMHSPFNGFSQGGDQPHQEDTWNMNPSVGPFMQGGMAPPAQFGEEDLIPEEQNFESNHQNMGLVTNKEYNQPIDPRSPRKGLSPKGRESYFTDLTKKCRDILLNKKSSKKQDQSTFVEDQPTIEKVYQEFSLSQLFELSRESKESSILVQGYLEAKRSTNPHQLDQVAEFLCNKGDDLLLDKFGNYVMQHLVVIHKPSRDQIASQTLHHFIRYAEDEYGSRIMQKLCSECSEYCKKALDKFRVNFNQLIKNITGSILLSKLISKSKSEQWYSWTIDILSKETDLLKKAYFNRMLSTLVTCCSETVLARIVEMIKQQIWILMNDKFGNYVL